MIEAVLEQNQFRNNTVEELSDFFHNLFFLQAEVSHGGVFDIHNMPSFVVSVYRNPDEAIIGALLLDIPAAACLAGALCDLPKESITKIIESQSFTDDIWGDLQEVLTICSQLFTSANDEDIELEEVYLHPTSLPDEAFEVLADDFAPLLFRLAIDRYGGGVMAVLDAENNQIFADTSNPSPSEQLGFEEDYDEDIDDGNSQGRFNEPSFTEEEEEEEQEMWNHVPTVEPIQKNSSATGNRSRMMLVSGMLIGLLVGGIGTKMFFVSEAPLSTVSAPEQSPAETVTPPIQKTVQVVEPVVRQPFQNVNDIQQVFMAKDNFHMGCTTEYSTECLADEFPSHSVRLTKDYYIMKHEVTQALYRQVMKVTPSQFLKCGADCPVENISWVNAVTFANRLSEYNGLEQCYSIDGLNVTWDREFECLGWRLPTEAEWELAGRGVKGKSNGRFAKDTKQSVNDRTTRNTWVYAGGNTPNAIAWYGGFTTISEDNLGRKVGEGIGTTHKVCSKTPNDIGLCDMSGNVWEWVWDGYGSYSNTKKLYVNPTGNDINPQRVLRGGSWLSTPNELRTSYRMYATRSVLDTMVFNYGSFGVRLVRSSPNVKTLPN